MLLRLFISFLLILSVVACQNSEKNQIPLNYQITQLSSLVAATQYLQEQCGRSDLPDSREVIQYALHAAKNKGWNISDYNKIDENGFLPINRIKQRSKDIYYDLINDKIPKSEKCQEFNLSLTTFLDKINTSKRE